MRVCAGGTLAAVKRNESLNFLLSLSEVHLLQYKILHSRCVPAGRSAAFQTSAAVSGEQAGFDCVVPVKCSRPE